jgi:hypothetical protein
MEQDHFDSSGRFVLSNFQHARPFASLLPGIAGLNGIPIWAFYVNRGQAIASFGVENKDHAIMEFQPANKAYQSTSLSGFRTFLKLKRRDADVTYEPFAPGSNDTTRMFVGMNELEIEATSEAHDLQTRVRYFGLPGENLAALVRQVQITNLGKTPLTIEALDGMALVIPYGTTNGQLKEIGRTIEAWMEVFNVREGVPFYRLRANAEDTAEVTSIAAGHFYLAFTERAGRSQMLSPIVDPALVFGQNSSLITADRFSRSSLAELQNSPQITVGRSPCGFFGAELTLAPGETRSIHAVVGHVQDLDHLREIQAGIADPAYLASKHAEARELVDQLTQAIETHTSSRTFDAYCRQTFLDNVLRGGWPLLLGSRQKPAVFHVYSRKHGDLERDYNDFLVAAEMYSQGNGNYRDVNQNRRSDVLFNPAVEDFNVLSFLGLIQTDGYNPLVVKGSRFRVPPEKRQEILQMTGSSDELDSLLSGSFTPGQLMKTFLNGNLRHAIRPDDLLNEVVARAEQSFEAAFVEGYWVDHWTYVLDLIESYLSVYPDRRDALLFDRQDVPYFDSPGVVQPRERKYVLIEDRVRQYAAVRRDEEKAALIATRKNSPNLVRTDCGSGEIFRTSVFAKLSGLALLKFTTLDPAGMGIEMEAGKPGWYDALNGLPGLFGSSLCETFELARLLQFLLEVCQERPDRSIRLPIEQAALLNETVQALEVWTSSEAPDRDYRYWDAVSGSRESYRERTRLGLDGRQKTFLLSDLDRFLAGFRARLQAGIQRAAQMSEGPPPTYFSYTATNYAVITDTDGQPRVDDQRRSLVRVLAFEPSALPEFLEGPVHALKVQPDARRARQLYRRVRESGLYDRQLKMYKVNSCLADQSHEIGRARAFTAGWLENESIWLHMEYKYLLEVLRSGLYEEFKEDFRNVLIPFQDPDTYGRSPLENSSFIVSSAHPDKSIHGTGFVARLSGCTAEFLSIWNEMMAGRKPFFLRDGQLHLSLRPLLPGWLFTEQGIVSFRFLGACTVTYHNPARADCFAAGIGPHSISLQTRTGERVGFEGDVIPPPYAGQVRSGAIERIDVHLGDRKPGAAGRSG